MSYSLSWRTAKPILLSVKSDIWYPSLVLSPLPLTSRPASRPTPESFKCLSSPSFSSARLQKPYCSCLASLLQLHSVVKSFYASSSTSLSLLWEEPAKRSACGIGLHILILLPLLRTILTSWTFPPVSFPFFYLALQMCLSLSTLYMPVSLPTGFPTTAALPSYQTDVPELIETLGFLKGSCAGWNL